MSVLKAIGDFFRKPQTEQSTDQHSILAPLILTADAVEKTKVFLDLLKQDKTILDVLSRNGPMRPDRAHSKSVDTALKAYKDYVRGLPGHERDMETRTPLSTLMSGLTMVLTNIQHIEDNFDFLFGSATHHDAEHSVRSSSLVTIGYIERAGKFALWVGLLGEHLTASDDEHMLIAPFKSNFLTSQAASMSEFVALNLNKWSSQEGFIKEISDMQKRGSDVSVQSGGMWIDEFSHDNAFSHSEQDLMAASIRNPISMLIGQYTSLAQLMIEMLEAQKDWVISKIAAHEAKLRGMDPESTEYKKLQITVRHYADLISKYESRIERIRA